MQGLYDYVLSSLFLPIEAVFLSGGILLPPYPDLVGYFPQGLGFFCLSGCLKHKQPRHTLEIVGHSFKDILCMCLG